MRQRRVRAVQQALDVDLDHAIPLVERSVLDRAEEHHARVVDERVEAAELLDGLRDRALGLRRVSDVGLDHERAVADPPGHLTKPVAATRHERDLRPLRGEGERGRLTDATRGAGDECDGAAQLTHSSGTLPATAAAPTGSMADRRAARSR